MNPIKCSQPWETTRLRIPFDTVIVTDVISIRKKDLSEMPTPQLKNEKLYERLRDEGASKEKAARISNAAAKEGRSKVGKRGGKAEDYDDSTRHSRNNGRQPSRVTPTK